MNARQPGAGPDIDRSKNIEERHRLWLVSLRDELLRDKAVCKSMEGLHVDYQTMTARPEGGRLTRRMRVPQDDTGRKLTRRNMLDRVRRVLSLGMWRRWRQRAGCGVPIGFGKFH